MIYGYVENTRQECTVIAEHEGLAHKYSKYTLDTTRKAMEYLHVDPAVTLYGDTAQVMMDAYTKYPCIQRT